MKNHQNSNSGDEAGRFHLAAGELPASSPVRRIGEPSISDQSHHNRRPVASDVDGASIASPSTFIHASIPVAAVVMKVQNKRLRLKVAGRTREEEESGQR